MGVAPSRISVFANRWLLGLDSGTNSLGWAAFRLSDEGRPVRLLDGGVRLFEWGRDNKSKESLDSVRGQARRGRRRLRARSWRRDRLADLLRAKGVEPPDPVPVNVWALRAQAASGPTAGPDLAACLMHMARHRGFKSVRLGAELSVEQLRAAKEEQTRWDGYDIVLRQDMAAAGLATIGQLFALRLEPGGAGFVRARQGEGTVPSRRLVREEFECIRAVQGEALLAADAWSEIADLIFDQRPLGEPKRGRCTEFPEDERLPKAMPSAQRLMVRQTVANLRVAAPRMLARPRMLEASEYSALAELLDRGGTHTWPGLRTKVLKLAKQMRFTVETEKTAGAPKAASKRTRGDVTAEVLRPLLPGWDAMALDQRDALVTRMLRLRQDRRALARIAAECDVPADRHEEFADVVQFGLPRGTIAYGAKAVALLLERLGPEVAFHEACEQAFGHRHGEQRVELLPELPDYTTVLPGGRIRNVSVHIALGEIRKVVNALIHRYGRPHRVIIETTRELKAGAERLREISSEQAKRENENREADAEIAEAMKGAAEQASIGRTERLRRRFLFKRQSDLCPYCGRRLGFTDLFGAGIAVDHVVPHSLGGPNDNSNRVVAHRECNDLKRDKTPWQAFHGTDRWPAVEDFLDRLPKGNDGLKRRFGSDAIGVDDDEFLARQDRDTSYIARVALAYLKHVATDVVATRGYHTAYLRSVWELPKGREDQRHHFVDAAVIACTDRSIIKWLNTLHARHGGLPRTDEVEVQLPYPDFSTELWRRHGRLWPSIRPDHNLPQHGSRSTTFGELHNAQLFGIVEVGDGLVRRTRRRSPDDLFRVGGKPAGDKEVEAAIGSFVSEKFRNRFRKVLARLKAERPEAKLAELAMAAAKDTEFGPRGIGKIACFVEDENPRPRSELRLVRRGDHQAVVETSGNAWLEIRRISKGKAKKEAWAGHTVTRFDAAGRSRPSEPGSTEASDLVMILRRRDTVAWEQDGRIEFGWVKVIKSDGGRFFVWPLRVAETVDPKKAAQIGDGLHQQPLLRWALAEHTRLGIRDRDGRSFTAETFRAAKGRKVTVNILGRIRDPGGREN
ncbi:MAG: hypothetical protein GC191_20110 [Azospirillum sp.]|nr:hypothetical protein [Azospirillum sp.]